MTTFRFSEEAILFSKDYAIVREVEQLWRENLDQFQDALFAEISHHLGDMKQQRTGSTGYSYRYRYWSRKNWADKRGQITLWQHFHYPELIRDHSMELFVTFNASALRERVHPVLQSEAVPLLRGIRGLEVDLGEVNSDKPITLRVPWKEDPLEEGAPVLVETIRAIDQIVPSLYALTKAGNGKVENSD